MGTLFSEVKQLQIAEKYVLYLFGEKLVLYDLASEINQIEVDTVKEDILLFINELHDVDKVWTKICEEYGIDKEDKDTQNVLMGFVSEIYKLKLVEEGTRTKEVFGKVGAYFPISMTLEITDRCNLRCTHCYKEAEICNNTFLPVEIVKKIYSQIEGNVWHLDITGGEATLHPDFEEIVIASTVKSMALLTNGTNLLRIKPEVLSRFEVVQVTLYGTSQEEYERYTSVAAFQTAIEGIKRLIELEINTCVAISLRKTNVARIRDYI